MKNYSRQGSSMPPKEKTSKSTESANELEVIKYDKKAEEFVVKHHPTGNILTIVNTFAEMFPMLATSPGNIWKCVIPLFF